MRGCMSPEQPEICFLNKSSLVQSLRAARVEHVPPQSVLPSFHFQALSRGQMQNLLFTGMILQKFIFLKQFAKNPECI